MSMAPLSESAYAFHQAESFWQANIYKKKLNLCT